LVQRKNKNSFGIIEFMEKELKKNTKKNNKGTKENDTDGSNCIDLTTAST
jgi:hypothetical protein